ncbi:hypothetical protein BDN71DRAFT_1450340 [Pleurotus eryngii]|uniref:Uncharacterized protein n=1 Tax=Pleurotus eryngii TaxID=5323 RepID=A0A9P6D5E8_PLEER|nr:hypothetical protein BDN71DRAFT_1450340 [Pleurotus eryngii]
MKTADVAYRRECWNQDDLRVLLLKYTAYLHPVNHCPSLQPSSVVLEDTLSSVLPDLVWHQSWFSAVFRMLRRQTESSSHPNRDVSLKPVMIPIECISTFPCNSWWAHPAVGRVVATVMSPLSAHRTFMVSGIRQSFQQIGRSAYLEELRDIEH